MDRIYLDHAATTAISDEVLKEMLPYFREKYGNPSSLHSFGREARSAIDTARKRVAEAIGATPAEIYFTSGGSEADNWAIRGVAYSNANKGKHIITSAIEHHAVLHTCNQLEKEGFEVTYLPVDEFGLVSPSDLRKAIRKDTVLITIMYANNEIGTIEPIPELASIAKEYGIPFHTDAVQSVGKVPIDMEELPVDLMSISSHKLYGPKGVGALYIRETAEIAPVIFGSEQERGIWPGAPNIPGIVGFGTACSMALRDLGSNGMLVASLRGASRVPSATLPLRVKPLNVS